MYNKLVDDRLHGRSGGWLEQRFAAPPGDRLLMRILGIDPIRVTGFVSPIVKRCSAAISCQRLHPSAGKTVAVTWPHLVIVRLSTVGHHRRNTGRNRWRSNRCSSTSTRNRPLLAGQARSICKRSPQQAEAHAVGQQHRLAVKQAVVGQLAQAQRRSRCRTCAASRCW